MLFAGIVVLERNATSKSSLVCASPLVHPTSVPFSLEQSQSRVVLAVPIVQFLPAPLLCGCTSLLDSLLPLCSSPYYPSPAAPLPSPFTFIKLFRINLFLRGLHSTSPLLVDPPSPPRLEEPPLLRAH